MTTERKIFDVTLALANNLPTWPGDAPSRIEHEYSIANGDDFNSSRIQASLHWGTHLDAPYHLNPDGWGIDEIPLELLVGPAKVVELPEVIRITAAELKGHHLQGVQRLLFKTRNSHFWKERPLRFHPEFTALTADAARYLLRIGVRLIGIDYLSIDLFTAADLPVHRLLYRHNIPAIEGLNLGAVAAGNYQLICLPLKIRGGDGAPARVLLLSDDAPSGF